MAGPYKVIICWSQEDDAYVATVPERPGCAANGKTRQVALANVERVIQEWIDTASELGRAIPYSASSEEANKRDRRPGSAIGKLTIIEDDDAHLDDFRRYMPGDPDG